MKLILMITGAVLFLGGCFSFPSGSPEIVIRIPPLFSNQMVLAPKSPIQILSAPLMGDFECVRVNVVGRGIPDAYKNVNRDSEADSVVGGKSCSYPGRISGPINSLTGGTVTLNVPPGKSRVVQIVAIDDATNDTYKFCDEGPLDECSGSGCVNPKLYELGRALLNIESSMSVSIANTYDDLTDDALRLDRRVNCGSTDGTAPATTYKTYFYVASDATGSDSAGLIHIFSQDSSTNQLVAVSPAAGVAISGDPTAFKGSPNGAALFALVSSGGSTTLSGYATTASGTLGAEASSSTLTASSAKMSVSDKCIFTAVGSDQYFQMTPYTVSGSTVTFQSPIQTDLGVGGYTSKKAEFSANGANLYLYYTLSVNKKLRSYTVASDCALSGAVDQTLGLQPSQLLFSSIGLYGYSIGTSSSEILGIDSATGNVNSATADSILGTSGAIDHTGDHIALINGSYSITLYQTSGSSFSATTSSVSSNSSFVGMIFDPTGNYLFVSKNDGAVDSYIVNRSTHLISGPFQSMPVNTTGTNSVGVAAIKKAQ